MTIAVPPLEEPFRLTETITLRNRLVATAHGRAAVSDGLSSAWDAEYWSHLSAGGVAMCIAGGTVTAAESTARSRVLTEAWRPEALPGLRQRADAMRGGGAAAVLQILHLGRETLGANRYHAPVGPSAIRSPREPTAPRALTDGDVDDIVEGFRLSAANAAEAGFDGIELHAAHGYLLGQFLSPVANRRPGAETLVGRLDPIARIARAVRGAAPGRAVGIRLSVGDPDDAGLSLDHLRELLPRLDDLVDYVNLTVGMRGDYVRDMATSRPPLLDEIGALRSLTARPLLVSQGFRDVETMEAALTAGADLVGMARALIADPDLPRKLFGGRAREVRPCVACNEDCRAFDPTLLCSVNPDLAAPGDRQRQASPLRVGPPAAGVGRVAVVGAGPAGLEAALTLQRAGARELVVFEADEEAGGALRTVARAPNRGGWQRIVDFYLHNLDPDRTTLRQGTTAGPGLLDGFDAAVVAVGAAERLPGVLRDTPRAGTVSEALEAGPAGLRGVRHVLVVDDGFAWWPAVNALELAIAAGVEAVTVVTPGSAFATALPAESQVGLFRRLRASSVRLAIRPLTALVGGDATAVTVRAAGSSEDEAIEAEAVIAVGERSPRDWSAFAADGLPLVVAGDAIVPRRAAHAVSEGRAAGTILAAALAVAPAQTAETSR